MVRHEHNSVPASSTTTVKATHREFILTIFCPAFLHFHRTTEEVTAASHGPK